MELYPDWMDSASCKDLPQTMFFLADGASSIIHERRMEKELSGMKVCRRCPVQKKCLDYAVANDISYGLWGGQTSQQRRALARKLRVIDGKPPTRQLPRTRELRVR